MTANRTLRELQRELDEFRERYSALSRNELFVMWFIRAFLTENEKDAAESICGQSSDKGVDAALIDRAARIVFLVQGKYRTKIGARGEHRSDLIAFAQLAASVSGDMNAFRDLTRSMSPEVCHRLSLARKAIRSDGYSIHLYYVTTGRCSPSLEEEASRIVENARRVEGTPKSLSAVFFLIDGRRIVRMFADYLDGVAPPVPQLELDIEPSGGSAHFLNRHDGKTGIESWVFSIRGSTIADLFERAGTRLFARNIRGYLGKTDVNRGMEATLRKEPEHFWYYNNGVTIVCDDASLGTRSGRSVLHVSNPQIINGQQTTRTLAEATGKSNPASILTRVIRIPRQDGSDHFDALVSQIVAATNWQNQIRASDLMSNDRRQIEIQRQLHKLNYLYIRKRMTKGEARRSAAARYFRTVRKEEFAQVVAAIELDPSTVQSGRELLFEEQYYTRIFSTAEPNYYLSRYWLFRLVNYMARGNRERTYAKWLVLHHLWPLMDPICRVRGRAEVFRQLCEANHRDLVALYRGIDLAYRAVHKFFYRKRGSGRDALDARTFFKRRRLHEEFAAYWCGSHNPYRRSFVKHWEKFSSTVDAAP